MPVTVETYYKLAEICELEKPDQFIISGDVVYLDKISLTSNLAVQQAYNQLKEFKPIANIWSQITFKTSIDDHDVGFNDTFGNLLGFVGQTYPATVLSTNQADVSQKTPNISPIDSYIITCNFINSK
jgi:hypothetical protein